MRSVAHARLEPHAVGEQPADAGPGEVLAAARQALRGEEAASRALTVIGPTLVSAQADLYLLGFAGGAPRYVAKVARPGSGAPSSAVQYAALQTCHRWWGAEDRHGVAEPIALLPGAGGFLMRHVPGRSLSHILPRVLSQPATAVGASTAAGEFLRRFHRHGRAADAEVDLSQLVAEIRALQAADLASAGLALPGAVERTLDRAPAERLRARRVRLHGDFTPRNLILTPDRQVVMIDPILEADGLAEDDMASFLTMTSSAPLFAGGLLLPQVRRARERLERAFLTGYGPEEVSPVLLGLRLIHTQIRRWTYRRRRDLRPGERRFAALRARLIDAQMSALLEQSAAALDGAFDDAGLSRISRARSAPSHAAPASAPP